jgi:hypothetical protein
MKFSSNFSGERYLETRLTNAAIEAVNGLLQMAKRIARGFRNFHYFRIAAYLKAARLNLQIPHALPTRNVEEAFFGFESPIIVTIP